MKTHMEVREHVVSAARAVLDMVEREWQPLSAGELELRLDQAVEEILESELRAQLEAQPAAAAAAAAPAAAAPLPPPPLPPTSVYLRLLQGQSHVEAPTTPAGSREQEAAGSQQEPDNELGAAVKYISGLLQSSTSGARLAGRARLSLPHTVLLSLTLLTQRLSYRCVSRRFRLEKGNIHRIFFSFCQRVNALQDKIICWPHGEDAVDALVPFSSLLVKEEEQQEVQEEEMQVLPQVQEEEVQEEEVQEEEVQEEVQVLPQVQEEEVQEEVQVLPQVQEEEEQEEEVQEEVQVLPQVLGVLGHTRVPIRLPRGKQEVGSSLPEVKRMRAEPNPASWLEVELVCDRRGRFLHCSVSRGWDGERGGGALADRLRRNPELLPPGSVLVAGAGYPLSARVLTPYASGRAPREELFNKTLEEHLVTLDRAVARLRARFPRLSYLDIGNYERARAVALTACALHNLFVDIEQEAHGAEEGAGHGAEEGAGHGAEEGAGHGAEEGEGAGLRDGDVDEEGVRLRDAVAELLFTMFHPGRT